MKYQVLGPRILLKVQKMSQYYPGTQIVMAQQDTDKETALQTIGHIEEIGPQALSNEDYGLPGANLRVGDRVHFQRYGAQRLKSKEGDENEYWVINAKDLLCKEV